MKEKELAKFVDWLVQSGETPEGASFDETVSWINELATSEEGQQILGRLIQTYKNKEMGIFKEGGKLDYLLCLKKGGSIQDCGCGKKIEKAQDGSDGLRERGSVNAYRGRYPEFNEDSTWTVVSTPNGPAHVKNVFSGDTLEQHVVTEGINGVPRRTIRSITEYNNPAQSDTTYIDANGLEAGRNPGLIAKLFGNVHSDKFMDNLDAILTGMEPRQLSEKEVKMTAKKQDGGEISRRYALGALRATGSGNAESRQEYREKKREARESGLRGMDAINAARQSAIDKAMWRITPVLSDEVEIDNYNVELSPEIRNLAPQELGVSIQGYNEHMGDKRFKNAFRRARKYGLKEFEWNGKRYNTNLKGPETEETTETAKIVTSETPSIPVYIPENKNSLIENIKAAIINNAPYMK